MKTQVVHRVPLSLQAIAVLDKVRGLHGEWLFPSPRKQVPLTDMALTTLLRRVDAPSTTPGRLATAHGFRSTFRDWCSEQGYPRDLAERALAHLIQNKVEAAYHRTDLLDQRRPMMDAWAEFVRMYGDGIHLTVAHKREWSYGFKPDNKTVPLPCYPESPYDHQRESSTSQTQPARARQRAQ